MCHLPVNGLNLFSKSNCCFPMVPRSTFRSGQIAYSSIVLLIWKILSVIPSGAGPTSKKGRKVFRVCYKYAFHRYIRRQGMRMFLLGTVLFYKGSRSLVSFSEIYCWQYWRYIHWCKKCWPPGKTLPPLEILNLIPKSPFGPPGLWLAVKMMPPMALIFLIIQETAGVERIPFCPITKRPI